MGEDRPVEDYHDGNDISSTEMESDGETTTTITTGTKTSIMKETLTTKVNLLGIKHWSKEDVKLYLDNYMNVFDATELSEIQLVVTEGKHRMVR